MKLLMIAQYHVPKATRGRVRTPKALHAKSTRSTRSVLTKLSECDASSHRFHYRNITVRSMVTDSGVVTR
jgi:hypothetical protein